MDKVLFLSGTTRGGTLEGIGRAFAPVLKAMEIELVEVSLHDLNPLLQLLRSGALEQFKFVLSCVGMGMDLTTNQGGSETNLWQQLGVPFITLHGDSPAYFFDRHVVPSNNFISLYAFAEHRELRARLPLRQGPTGILAPIVLDEVPLEELDLDAKRNGSLIFLKNGKNPADIKDSWMESLDAPVLKSLLELADELENHLDAPQSNQIDDRVTRYFEDRGFDLVQLMKLRLLFIAQLDDYLRAVKGTRIVSALLDLPVQIRGNNWHHVDFAGKRATYIDDCNYVDSIGLIRQSLGMIDMSPNTASMPHDRVLRAYGAHTLCLSNGSQGFLDTLPFTNELSYSFEKDQLCDVVNSVLSQPVRAVEMGVAVADAFRRLHPPEDSFQAMLRYASFAKLDQARQRVPGLQDFFVWPPQIP